MSPIKDSSIYILDKIYYINAKSVCLNNAGPGVLATTLHDHSSRAGLVLAMTMTGRLERNWKMTAPAVFLDVRVTNLPMNSRKEVIFLNHYFLKSITLSTSTICISRNLVYCCRMLSVCTLHTDTWRDAANAIDQSKSSECWVTRKKCDMILE